MGERGQQRQKAGQENAWHIVERKSSVVLMEPSLVYLNSSSLEGGSSRTPCSPDLALGRRGASKGVLSRTIIRVELYFRKWGLVDKRGQKAPGELNQGTGVQVRKSSEHRL